MVHALGGFFWVLIGFFGGGLDFFEIFLVKVAISLSVYVGEDEGYYVIVVRCVDMVP